MALAKLIPLLPQTSKTLNYLTSPLTVPYFSLFIGVWVYLRHYINLVILTSILTTFSTIGPFDLNWETQQYKCRLSQVITFSLLACLQAINLFWLYFIVKVATNVVFAKKVADVRSDGEEDEEMVVVVEARETMEKIEGVLMENGTNGSGNGMIGGGGMNGKVKGAEGEREEKKDI